MEEEVLKPVEPVVLGHGESGDRHHQTCRGESTKTTTVSVQPAEAVAS